MDKFLAGVDQLYAIGRMTLEARDEIYLLLEVERKNASQVPPPCPQEPPPPQVVKYPYYYKDVRHLKVLDVYRVLDLYKVTNPCLQHAIKKLLVPGGRGAGKEFEQDIREASDSLNRALQLIAEDCNAT